MGLRNILEKFNLDKIDIKSEYIIAAVLVWFAVVMRTVPHPANFAPITALAIFGAYKLPKKVGFLLPLSAMVISDFIIGTHNMIFWTWGSFVAIALLSRLFVKKGYSADRLIFASLSGSFLFFIVTNFGVWAQGWLYPRTLEGLGAAYYNGIPFFRGTLLGDLFYTGVIFGAYHLMVKSAELLSKDAVRSQATN